MKTAEIMYEEGWCKDCNYSYLKCMKKGICKGYIAEEEETEENDATEKDTV